MAKFPRHRVTLRAVATAIAIGTTLAASAVAQPPGPPAAGQAPAEGPRPPAPIPQPGADSPSLSKAAPAPPQQAEPPRPSQATAPACAPVVCSTKGDVWTAKDWASVIAAMSGPIGLLVGLGAIWSNIFSTRGNNNQKTNEAEVTSIADKLDGFYGPYTQLSNTNKLIADELKSRHREKGQLRILLLLLNPDWRSELSQGDQALVDEIIKIDEKLLSLIQENAGMVDAAIQPYLYRAAAHFRMMILAHSGKLDNEPERYRSYVYPNQLDGVLQMEIDRLQGRLSALRQEPMKLHPPALPPNIPANLALEPWPA